MTVMRKMRGRPLRPSSSGSSSARGRNRSVAEYLNALPQADADGLYGLIFAAATDFSKAARDLFREKTRELGFGETCLWGKGEIEDALFQPKNDNLLFGYFGFSLKTRQRNLKTELRS